LIRALQSNKTKSLFTGSLALALLQLHAIVFNNTTTNFAGYNDG